MNQVNELPGTWFIGRGGKEESRQDVGGFAITVFHNENTVCYGKVP